MSAQVSTLKEIAVQIDAALKYSNAKTETDERAIDAVVGTYDVVCRELRPRPEDGTLEQALPSGLDGNHIGRFVIVTKEGASYSSAIRAVVRGIHATVDFEITSQATLGTPAVQRKWSLRVAGEEYGLDRFLDYGGLAVAREIERRLLAHATPRQSEAAPQGGSAIAPGTEPSEL